TSASRSPKSCPEATLSLESLWFWLSLCKTRNAMVAAVGLPSRELPATFLSSMSLDGGRIRVVIQGNAWKNRVRGVYSAMPPKPLVAGHKHAVLPRAAMPRRNANPQPARAPEGKSRSRKRRLLLWVLFIVSPLLAGVIVAWLASTSARARTGG